MNIENFDLNLLRLFDAMMLERNVTRAAQRLFLSQPATSHALARLRLAMDDPLFLRAGNDMIPTTRAEALAPAVRAALKELEHALGDSKFDPRTATAEFRLAMTDFSESLFAPLISAILRDEAPHIRIVVQSYMPSTVAAELASGALDFVIGMTQSNAPGIHSQKAATQSMVGLVRNDHPLTQARGGRPSARKFEGVPRLAISLQSGRFSDAIERALLKAGVTGKIVYATPHFFAVPTLLMNSDMLLVTAEGVASVLCAQHPLATLPLPATLPPLEPNLLWHERTHRDPARRWLRQRIQEAYRRRGSLIPVLEDRRGA